jgi:F-type H+-transporting ATPase subunit a
MFTHLVPIGRPIALSFFMVFIETIRNIIRPITLSVRLAANIVAGHLLLSLLRNTCEAQKPIYLVVGTFLATLIILEYAVAAIQGYVFVTLISLYMSETN